MSSKWEQEPAVQRFREYLQIPSVHPDVNYDACVTFLKKEAASMNLPVIVVEVVPGKPVVILTWQGLQPELPAIMLNSHMDVVPVYEECWTHPPFAATITDDGWIWARGSQDMKVVGIQHMEAVRRLKESGVRLKRTVHLTYVPDEEIGSYEGMRIFVDTKEFQDLNLGFALDEAMPFSGHGSFITFTGERTTWQIKVKCPGTPAHGSLLASNTAGEKLNYILDKFMKARAVEKSKVDAGVWIGDVTTINLTKVEGGVQANVLPESLTAVFDLRLSTELNHEEFEDQINTWCKEAGDDVTYEFTQRNPVVPVTRTDGSNPYWIAFRDTVEAMNINIQNLICPGATDARFIRSKGIPAVGFTPLMQTPTLLHAHDERILVKEFLNGIDIMQKVVEAVDSEIDGAEGMNAFVNSPEFNNVNIGFALDKGTASFETSTITAYNHERSIWQVVVKFNGENGHSSSDTAAEKGEALMNIIPQTIYAGFDVRLASEISPIAFESQIKSWCKQAGGSDVTYQVVYSAPKVEPTPADESNPFWMAIKTAVEGMGLTVKEEVCPGATDARFFKAKGIPAIGLTPLLETGHWHIVMMRKSMQTSFSAERT